MLVRENPIVMNSTYYSNLRRIFVVTLTLSCFAKAQEDAVIIVQFGDQSVSVNDTRDFLDPIIDGATLRTANLNVGLYTYVLDDNITLTPAAFCEELLDADPDILLCVPDMTFFDRSSHNSCSCCQQTTRFRGSNGG